MPASKATAPTMEHGRRRFETAAMKTAEPPPWKPPPRGTPPPWKPPPPSVEAAAAPWKRPPTMTAPPPPCRRHHDFRRQPVETYFAVGPAPGLTGESASARWAGAADSIRTAAVGKAQRTDNARTKRAWDLELSSCLKSTRRRRPLQWAWFGCSNRGDSRMMTIPDPRRGFVRCVVRSLGLATAAVLMLSAAPAQRAEALSPVSPGAGPTAKYVSDG